jgi:membrane protein
MPRDRPLWPIDALMEIGRDWIGRFIAIQGVDRAMAIGAQAYTALIPLLIVYAALLPNSTSFADALIDRFALTGSSAESVRQAFAASGTVESSVTALGALLLIISALSFTRGMQRLYEGAYGLPTRGMRNTKWGLVWLAVISVVSAVRPHLLGALSGQAEIVGSLALSGVLWLVTPYLLLGRRMRWQRLAPVAVLSTIGMTGVGIWSVIWMPHTISSSAQQFGMIGIGFALLAWLVSIAGVLVVATTGGAMVADRLDARKATAA